MGVPTSTGNEPKDPIDDYDRQHGTPTLADEQKPTGLAEGSNKEPPHYNPIKGAK